MASADFERDAAALGIVWKAPSASPADLNAPLRNHRVHTEGALLIEKDLLVPTRYGNTLWCDIFRPTGVKEPLATLVIWTPYGKHLTMLHQATHRLKECGIKPGDVSKHAPFEAVDPEVWCPKGYAIVVADVPGLWMEPGVKATLLSPLEAAQFADLVEWAAKQPWSNGNVGTAGVSYLAQLQWRMAELRPPSLKAMHLQEGWTDTYREVFTHGGIPDSTFWKHITSSWTRAEVEVEDMSGTAHPFNDEWWDTKRAKFEEITCPAYITACWADQGLHTRGTIEGYKNIKSERKYLEVLAGYKWAQYYFPKQVAKQMAWFDYWLKGDKTKGVDDWPNVVLHVREQDLDVHLLESTAWPLPNTKYTKLYLDDKTLAPNVPKEAGKVIYEGSASGIEEDLQHAAKFMITFDTHTNIVGNMKAKLFASQRDSNDMDLFLAIYKIGRDGKSVQFPFYAQFKGPAALGWIRASHRELDHEKSTEYQPVLLHKRELLLGKDEIVELDIEIWPSAQSFEKGESMLLVIQGTDLIKQPRPIVHNMHERTRNRGPHTIYTGGDKASYLLTPFV